MSNKVDISEFEFVDAYHSLGLSKKYVRDSNKDVKRLTDVFAYFGLKIAQFKSDTYYIILRRYNRILLKIGSNKKASRDIHYDFMPDKLFFSENDFPDFCTKETSTR